MRPKMWYYKHFKNHKFWEELSKPPSGEYVIVRESQSTSTIVKKEELEEYMQYLKKKDNLQARLKSDKA